MNKYSFDVVFESIGECEDFDYITNSAYEYISMIEKGPHSRITHVEKIGRNFHKINVTSYLNSDDFKKEIISDLKDYLPVVINVKSNDKNLYFKVLNIICVLVFVDNRETKKSLNLPHLATKLKKIDRHADIINVVTNGYDYSMNFEISRETISRKHAIDIVNDFMCSNGFKLDTEIKGIYDLTFKIYNFMNNS